MRGIGCRGVQHIHHHRIAGIPRLVIEDEVFGHNHCTVLTDRGHRLAIEFQVVHIRPRHMEAGSLKRHHNRWDLGFHSVGLADYRHSPVLACARAFVHLDSIGPGVVLVQGMTCPAAQIEDLGCCSIDCSGSGPVG